MYFNPQHNSFWHRIPNFMTFYNKYFADNEYLKALFNTYCCLKIDGTCRSLFDKKKIIKFLRDNQKNAVRYTQDS